MFLVNCVNKSGQQTKQKSKHEIIMSEKSAGAMRVPGLIVFIFVFPLDLRSKEFVLLEARLRESWRRNLT
jgi:hypothetical protein